VRSEGAARAILAGSVAMLVALAMVPVGDAVITGKNPSQALDLASAMEALPGLVTGASFVTYANPSPPLYPAAVADTPVGSVFTATGTDYAILQSGDAESADDPSYWGTTSFSTSYKGANDATVLKVDVVVPPGHNCLTVDFQFLSVEYPTFVGTIYNDAFIAELDVHTWTVGAGGSISAPDNFAIDALGNPITINSATMSAANAAGTPFGGGTDFLSAMTPVTPGPHSLYLSIFDASDWSLDSTVLLDRLTTFPLSPSACITGVVTPPKAPTAAIDVKAVPCHNDVALFLDASAPAATANLTKAVWDFGDGTTLSFAPPVATVGHVYKKPGTYTVTLNVTQSDGQTDETKETITVCNDAPILSNLEHVVIAGHTVQFAVKGEDPNGDAVTVALASPAPPTILVQQGDDEAVVHWPTKPTDVGTHTVLFSATDPWGAVTKDAAVIEVVPPAGVPDAARDGDADGIPDTGDNCPQAHNPTQADGDGDGRGDACADAPPGMGDEAEPRVPAAAPGEPRGIEPVVEEEPPVEEGACDACDTDLDGIPDTWDVCPAVMDVLQRDTDGDGVGDRCDPDLDGDGVGQLDALGRLLDNCPYVANAEQADADGDGVGDVCEKAPACEDCGGEDPAVADPAPGVARHALEEPGGGTEAVTVWPYALGGVAAFLLVGAVTVAVLTRR